MALKQAQIFTITSVKGGTGKTTAALSIAGLLSKKELKTIVVDLDLYSGGIAPYLNLKIDNDIFSLTDDMLNNRFKQMEDYTVKFNDYLDILAAPKDPRNVGKIETKYIETILNRLKLKYDVILIDTNHTLDNINLSILDISDKIVYVIGNDILDFKNMKTMSSIYKDMGKTNFLVVLNESKDNNKNYYTKYDIKNIIKTNIDYIIPKSLNLNNYDKYVFEGKILSLEKGVENSKGIKILDQITNRLLEKE